MSREKRYGQYQGSPKDKWAELLQGEKKQEKKMKLSQRARDQHPLGLLSSTSHFRRQKLTEKSRPSYKTVTQLDQYEVFMEGTVTGEFGISMNMNRRVSSGYAMVSGCLIGQCP